MGQAEATQQAIAEQHQRECVRPGEGGYDVALYESPYCRYLRRQLREANLEWAELRAGSALLWMVGMVKKYGGTCGVGAIQGAVLAGPGGAAVGAVTGCLVNVTVRALKSRGKGTNAYLVGSTLDLMSVARDLRAALLKATGNNPVPSIRRIIAMYRASMRT